jgi:hypothetical protein
MHPRLQPRSGTSKSHNQHKNGLNLGNPLNTFHISVKCRTSVYCMVKRKQAPQLYGTVKVGERGQVVIPALL